MVAITRSRSQSGSFAAAGHSFCLRAATSILMGKGWPNGDNEDECEYSLEVKYAGTHIAKFVRTYVYVALKKQFTDKGKKFSVPADLYPLEREARAKANEALRVFQNSSVCTAHRLAKFTQHERQLCSKYKKMKLVPDYHRDVLKHTLMKWGGERL